MYRRILTLIVCAATIVGCSDAASPVSRLPDPDPNQSEGRGDFQRYVAMGTSITMGTQSDGTLAASQLESWAAQLSRRAHRELDLPLISGTGCRAPFQAPLSTGKRVSGESVSTPTASLACAPLASGITLPTRNVAIAAARTLDALRTTPETQADPFYKKLYQLVLPPQTTQLAAMRTQNPKIVSVEFGANEVLGAVSGVAISGATLFPYAAWVPLYRALADTVSQASKKAIMVGLIHDVATFPGMRRGDEIWADRAMFLAAFNVAVSSNCTGSTNLIFVPVRVPTAAGTGLAYRANGLPAFPFSCADGGTGVVDYVLTPAEAGVVNAQLSLMNSDVASIAAQYGFAHFELEALYGRSDLKAPFSVVTVMTSAQPYGPYISLDGIHPSGVGSALLADAAVQAVNTTYNMGIPASASFIASR